MIRWTATCAVSLDVHGRAVVNVVSEVCVFSSLFDGARGGGEGGGNGGAKRPYTGVDHSGRLEVDSNEKGEQSLPGPVSRHVQLVLAQEGDRNVDLN